MHTMQAELVKFLVEATGEVFRTMISMDLKPAAHVDEAVVRRDYAVTAMVGFGGQFTGLLTVSCSERMACRITEAMIGVPVPELGPDVTDALGEVSNMVGGNIVVKMAGRGNIDLSLPTVIVGRDYRYFVATREPIIRIHFQGPGEGVLVGLALDSKS
ncbi:MAG: chemotaxis protein CheX [Planctomycetes bacterium]|nr:chemotaxis protein CheX [Planctomycetota bacterium]MBI3843011.1 chemotaxis protein CheX [Planctomycetota bacterium]